MPADPSAAKQNGLTLRELQAIPVERLKGIGEKKLASLHEVGVETV
ncbi:MAG: hypothetical protein JWN39_1192, partial [Ilumatobacteraceae bacterium]|nr:hypothetical protein [Ilumatobacteraceae bacterium]